MRRLRPVPFRQVALTDAFWAPRQNINRRVTLPLEYLQMKKTGHLDAWNWKPGRPRQPHIFWDSDLGKWLEAAAYVLALHPEERRLSHQVDGIVKLLVRAQAKDGYLNSHFQRVAPDKRWDNLRDNHELYCAGHLIEAAVALADAGKPGLLEVMRRYTDLIARTFGRRPGQIRGYCGHPEIELALIRLARLTGLKRDRELARYFIEERGRDPNFIVAEDRRHKRQPYPLVYLQADRPVRRQTEAAGHAVRAGYLYSAATDLAAETGDRDLLAVCRKIWRSIVERRMYVIGGIGSSRFSECFTFDYDLPNEEAYAETCANISLVFFAHRLLQLEPDRAYSDVIERALYNGVLSGVSLDGTRFFYDNRLASKPEAAVFNRQNPPERQAWFGCACCPPNLARTLASLGQYVYSQSERELYVHLFIEGRTEVTLADRRVAIAQRTRYPWAGKVTLTLAPEMPTDFTLALRIPGWCRKTELSVNGKPLRLDPAMRKGYVHIRRTWRQGDRVVLDLAMPVERIEAHPSVRHDTGRVALQRGPLVYAVEEADNGKDLADLILPQSARLTPRFEPGLLGGVVSLQGWALRRDRAGWSGRLYRSEPSRLKKVRFKAVPYAFWANRGQGEMLVWVRME
jgi:hypothetical protein